MRTLKSVQSVLAHFAQCAHFRTLLKLKSVLLHFYVFQNNTSSCTLCTLFFELNA